MDRLFHSFSQIDESITRDFGGSGLGFTISKDLARLLDGDCTASSTHGKGSRFNFSFVADRSPESPISYSGFPSPKQVLRPRRPCCFRVDVNSSVLVVCPGGPGRDLIRGK
jgi:hypothetical protein